MTECEVCGVQGHESRIDEHHISYQPEETLQVCSSCHTSIHNGEIRPDLIPSDSPEFIEPRLDRSLLEDAYESIEDLGCINSSETASRREMVEVCLTVINHMSEELDSILRQSEDIRTHLNENCEYVDRPLDSELEGMSANKISNIYDVSVTRATWWLCDAGHYESERHRAGNSKYGKRLSEADPDEIGREDGAHTVHSYYGQKDDDEDDEDDLPTWEEYQSGGAK